MDKARVEPAGGSGEAGEARPDTVEGVLNKVYVKGSGISHSKTRRLVAAYLAERKCGEEFSDWLAAHKIALLDAHRMQISYTDDTGEDAVSNVMNRAR